MEMRIEIDDELVAEVDRIAGSDGRDRFVRDAIRRAVEDDDLNGDMDVRWDLIQSAAGSIADTGHDWDDDPAEWVRQQRRGDPRRGG